MVNVIEENERFALDARQQALLERQAGLEGALHRWHDGMIAEEHTRDAGQNERNIRALRARATGLHQELRNARRELKVIRRAQNKLGEVR